MKQHRLQFDAPSHTYTLDGRPVPGVTSRLRAMAPGWKAQGWYLERGRVVHDALGKIASGVDLDWVAWGKELRVSLADSLAAAIEGRVRAGQSWLRATAGEVQGVEVPVYSVRYQYAGTIDLVYRWGQRTWLVDWKGCIEPAVELQLAAYKLAYEECHNGRKIDGGIAVELRDNGAYKVKPFTLKHGTNIWLAGLTWSNWMAQNYQGKDCM